MNEKAEAPETRLSIDKETINDLPLEHYEGQIIQIDSDAQVESALKVLENEYILGFDTESRPSFRKGQNYPPALLQLAGANEVFLFQLLQIENMEPLFSILSDPDRLKVGVAIHDDIRKLQDSHPFSAAGFIELSELTQKAGIVNTGLRSLAALLLGFRISKSAQVTNWARSQLSEAQIRYAATDAWASREIYLRLQELGWT